MKGKEEDRTGIDDEEGFGLVLSHVAKVDMDLSQVGVLGDAIGVNDV